MLTDADSLTESNADVIDSPTILLAIAHVHLAELLSAQNRIDEAEEQYGLGIKFAREQVSAFPDVGFYQLQLGKSYLSRGSAVLAANRPAEAMHWLNESLRIWESRVPVSDETPAYRQFEEETRRRLHELERLAQDETEGHSRNEDR
jgi:hypothetical protein